MFAPKKAPFDSSQVINGDMEWEARIATQISTRLCKSRMDWGSYCTTCIGERDPTRLGCSQRQMGSEGSCKISYVVFFSFMYVCMYACMHDGKKKHLSAIKSGMEVV